MILVAGATGVVGRALTELLPSGRRPWTELSLRPRAAGWDSGPRTVLTQDVADTPALLAALPQVRSILHLAGVAPGQKPTRPDAELAAMRSLLEVARARGVERFVFLSACGAAVDSGHAWLRAKGEAEALLRDSGVPFVIWRASLVTAPAAPALVALAKLARSGGALRLPLLRGGRVQPIAAGDAAIAMASALDDHRVVGQTVDIGRTPPLSLDELCECIARRLGAAFEWSKLPFVGRALEEALSRVRLVEGEDESATEPLLSDASSWVRLFAVSEPPALTRFERLLPMQRQSFLDELRSYPWGAPPPRPGDPLPVIVEDDNSGLPLFIPGEALRDPGERAKLPPAWIGHVDPFGKAATNDERSSNERRFDDRPGKS